MEAREKGKFLKVACPRCSNHQIIFGKSALNIKCNKCNKLLARTSGGKTHVRAKIREVKHGN